MFEFQTLLKNSLQTKNGGHFEVLIKVLRFKACREQVSDSVRSLWSSTNSSYIFSQKFSCLPFSCWSPVEFWYCCNMIISPSLSQSRLVVINSKTQLSTGLIYLELVLGILSCCMKPFPEIPSFYIVPNLNGLIYLELVLGILRYCMKPFPEIPSF